MEESQAIRPPERVKEPTAWFYFRRKVTENPKFLWSILSWTFLNADYRKKRSAWRAYSRSLKNDESTNEARRKAAEAKNKVIRELNGGRFIFSAIFAFILFLLIPLWNWITCAFLLFLVPYAFFRVNEIAYAFFRDAIDHLRQKAKPEEFRIPYHERVQLAFKSYFELALDYGFIFAGLRALEGHSPSILESVSFAARSMLTLGPDLIPGAPNPTPLMAGVFSAHAAFTGVILLVVCFTIYTSYAIDDAKKSAENPRNR